MPTAENRILKKLLDRLFASLLNGPSLNCRPYSSRQRVDLNQLAKLKDLSPELILRTLLGPDREAKVAARVRPPKQRKNAIESETTDDEPEDGLTPEERAAKQAWADQQTVLTKLRAITDDARTYENDTGVHTLQIGYPLLSLPPGASGKVGLTRRILAPLAFVSLSMSVKAGPTPTVVFEANADGADLVVPNVALLAWLEQQTGQPFGEVDPDETGEKPWTEICSIAKRVCELLQVELPAVFTGEAMPEDFALQPAPRTDADEEPMAKVIAAAIVGLFPMSNQGLLRDMQAMVDGEPVSGPIESFISAGVSLEPPKVEENVDTSIEKHTRDFSQERLVATADPCQARAVRLARTSRGLVVHGPPGTGKSQTIANIIGDHLARGERVLFVCDKRTALDVVMNRLQGMGLSSLCGIVHDPQRDQRELYKSIREQLDNLPELNTDAAADGKLSKIDAELQRLHGELTEYHAALMKRPDKDSLSFHELMGRWLELPTHAVTFDAKTLELADRRVIDENAQALSDLSDRAAKVGYVSNPWKAAAGLTIDEYLTTPVESLREQVAKFVIACEAADAAIDPATPPVAADADLTAVAAARSKVADEMEKTVAAVPAELRAKWASVEPSKVVAASKSLVDVDVFTRKIEATSLDRELLASVRASLPTVGPLSEQIAALDAYVESTKSMLAFLAIGKKSAATKVLAKFGLQPSAETATRVSASLTALKSRLLLRDLLVGLDAQTEPLPSDDTLLNSMKQHRMILALLIAIDTDTHLTDVRTLLRSALAPSPGTPGEGRGEGDFERKGSLEVRNHPHPNPLPEYRERGPEAFVGILRGLRATAIRVKKLTDVAKSLMPQLFAESIKPKLVTSVKIGEPVAAIAKALSERFDSLENVLRVRDGLSALPKSLQAAASQLVDQNVTGDTALAILRKAADSNEINRRLEANRLLTSVDDQKLQSSFTRYEQFEAEKKQLVRQSILHRWGGRQKEKLLAGTGSRLNGFGADLRRRLTTRGQRAMRLRQVISIGQTLEGGDPLYDLRPVWMASPETVAQIFPRLSLFDVVVFDEASQCRLEEAMPVLLRAKRVVIAGDPKQLPPTRFFESAVAASEDEEIETDQQLFETQQGEIEDLLAAALNIEIDECYLDVHYRSRNSDLIEFSNQRFYNARLQAIPGHPHNRSRFAPLTLYNVNGVYEKRANVAEAEKVCAIVRDLLKRGEPPSIGIACFNLTQRDLIVEKLEALAGEDADFAKGLAAARERRSESSFEGLFVKNLENVQGDERDHMIISTTYGPDAKGKFYRRFGPVGTAGGGRRLNVLVTRARDEVHLVTSIPSAVYRHLPPIPAGETPGGAWLLFAYLVYAEQLAAAYEQHNAMMQQVHADATPIRTVRPNRFPSNFAVQLGDRLVTQQKIGSDVHWGNDGFCVDLALHHPTRPEDVTIGVLTDMNRFEQAADPVEWEVFRNSVMKQQGWTFSRVWTPHYFRDRQAVTRAIVKDAEIVASTADDSNDIRVTQPK